VLPNLATHANEDAPLRSLDALTELNRLGCPSEEDHRAFLLGDLADAEADAIGQHLENCPTCEERSQRFDEAADPVVSALRHAIPLASTLSIGVGTNKPPGHSAIVGDKAAYIAGHEILGEVGRGGMGVVFKARQVRLNRLVALKMILSGPFANPEELVRFQVEGETLAKLTHPSIVQIFEIGQADGRPFFTMEWVEGGTLADRLSDNPYDTTLVGGKREEEKLATSTAGTPFPPDAAALLVEQLARAVQYAHENGVVHRDLKPANILLAASTANPEVLNPKVTDFGLAKPTWGVTNLTATGVVVGTPGYMAPEQARGDRLVGPAADVYSLGAILYELLTSRPPFPLPGPGRNTPMEVIGQVLDREPASPRRLNPVLPRDLSTICLKCLEKNPAARYASARDLADDLRRYQNGESVRAHPSGELRRVWKWAKRRPVIAGLLVAVAASLLLGAIVSTYFGIKARSSEIEAVKAQSVAVENASAADVARLDAERSRNASQRELARSDFQEGRRLAELGRVGEGMHWMLAALRQIPDEPEDRPFREMLRLNLGAWSGRLHRLRHMMSLPDEVNSVVFSPDGRLFAIGSHDRTIRIFDVDSGEPVGPILRAEARVNAMAFSPDGRFLVAGGEVGYQQGEHSRVSRFDLVPGREKKLPIEVPDDVWVESIAFARDGETFLVGGQERQGRAGAWLCRTNTGKRLGFVPVPSAETHRCQVSARTDGPGYVLACSGENSSIHVAAYDGVNASPWVEVDRAQHKTTIMFRVPDRLVVSDGKGIRCYEIPGGKPVVNFPRLGGTSWRAESPDGRFRAGGTVNSAVSVPGPLRLWDATTGIVAALIAPDDSYQKVAFSPDGRGLLAASEGGTIRLWDLAKPSPRPAEESESSAAPDLKRLSFIDMAFSRDRSTAVLAGYGTGVARVWRADRGMAVHDLPQHHSLFAGRERQISLTPDGKRVTALETGLSLRIWDVETSQPLPAVLPHISGISAQAMDPTGKIVASGDYSWNVQLWDVATGDPIGTPLRQSDIVFHLKFSPDGRTLAASTSKDWQRVYGVRMWNVASRTQVDGLIETGGATAARLEFNPDGTQLLTAASDGVRRWDTRSGKAIGELIPHAGGATTIAFSPDGRYFVTGSRTGLLRLWDANTGQAVGRAMPASSPAACLEFHPAGRLVAVGYADGTARVWDTLTAEPIGPPVAQPGPIIGVTFPPDGRVMRTAAADGSVRDWPLIAPFDGDQADFERSLAAWSGVRMGDDNVLKILDMADWRQVRRERPQSIPQPDWEETLAWDAEQAGDPQGSRWHLDRLITFNPNDWLLHARRGRASSNSGRHADAEADYKKAEAFAPASNVTEWYRQRSFECRGAKLWETARWYLDRLLAIEPSNWRSLASRAEVFRHLGQKELADKDSDAATREGADSSFLAQLADYRARDGRWPEASKLFQKALPKRPFDVAHSRAAIVFLKTGDQAAYQSLCRRLLELVGTAPSPGRANLVAALCALGPAGLENYAQPLSLTRQALADLETSSLKGTERSDRKHDCLTSLGSLLIRSGFYQDGIDRLKEGMKAVDGEGLVHDWIFLAMAYHHIGNPNEAAIWFKKAQGWKLTPSNEDFWDNMEVQLLLAEVEALIAARKKP